MTFINRRTAGVLACLSLVGVLAAGCGGSDPEPATPTPTAASVAALTPEQRAYLAGLKQIDAGLVANESRAVRRAEETCADIKGGMTGDALAKRVVERLSGGNATIDTAQAAKVVTLLQQTVCK